MLWILLQLKDINWQVNHLTPGPPGPAPVLSKFLEGQNSFKDHFRVLPWVLWAGWAIIALIGETYLTPSLACQTLYLTLHRASRLGKGSGTRDYVPYTIIMHAPPPVISLYTVETYRWLSVLPSNYGGPRPGGRVTFQFFSRQFIEPRPLLKTTPVITAYCSGFGSNC